MENPKIAIFYQNWAISHTGGELGPRTNSLRRPMCTCGNFVREFNEALSCPWAWLLSGLLGDLLSVAPFCCQSVSAVCCLLLVCSSPDGRKSGGFLSPERGGPRS